MSEVFKIINHFQEIGSIEELKTFADSIKLKIEVTEKNSLITDFNNFIKEISRIEENYNGFFNKGVLCKLTESNWIYIEQDKQNLWPLECT